VCALVCVCVCVCVCVNVCVAHIRVYAGYLLKPCTTLCIPHLMSKRRRLLLFKRYLHPLSDVHDMVWVGQVCDTGHCTLSPDVMMLCTYFYARVGPLRTIYPYACTCTFFLPTKFVWVYGICIKNKA